MLTEALCGGVAAAPRCARRFTPGGSAALLCAVVTLCGVLTGVFGANAAHAQENDLGTQRDFSIDAGIFVPGDTKIRSASATEIPIIEGMYTIQKFPESHFVSELGVGYLDHAAFRMIPLTVSQIYRDPGNASGFNYFYGVGVGAYITRLNTPDTDDRSKTLVGAFLVAGIDFTKTVFAEIKYHYISKYDNQFVGGTQADIGIRF